MQPPTSQPASYTSLATGAIPSFGTSGPAISALQTKYNTENPTATPLKVDGLYGINTYKALNPTGPAIISTNDVHRQGVKDSADLNTLMNGLRLGNPNSNTNTNETTPTKNVNSDSFLQGLKSLQTTQDQSTQLAIKNLQATYERNVNAENNKSDNYSRALQGLGIQTNEAQSTPDLLAGHLTSAANDHLVKLQDLDSKLTDAISKATLAQSTNDFKTLNDQMTYIKQLKAEQRQTITDANSAIVNSAKRASAEIDPTTAKTFLDAMNTISNPDDQKTFINAIAQKYGLSPVTVVTSLNGIVQKQQAADLAIQQKNLTIKNTEALIMDRNQAQIDKAKADAEKGNYNFTPTDQAALIGLQLTKNDIKNLENDINNNGIKAVIENPKSGLTSGQQTALETIFGYTPIDSSHPWYKFWK